jgi:hypothetical protein
MKVRTKLIGTIAIGAALLIPVAQAQRPDDRAGLHGPGAFASTETSAATHPDNRAGVRGPGTVAAERVATRPDDRGGVRGPGALGSPEATLTTHPDNRAGTRGPGSVTTVAFQPDSIGFDWRDGLLGALGGAGLALLLTGSAFLLMSQRSKARTA